MMKRILVLDATPLIYLAKAGILEKIGLLPEMKIITRSVYEEVVEKGKRKGEKDALYVEKLVQKNILMTKDFSGKKEMPESKNLSETDKEALCFCKKRNAVLITDDEELGEIADREKIENHGSVYLLFTFLDKKIINKAEFKETVHKMIKGGWYCSIEFYDEIMGELERRKIFLS